MKRLLTERWRRLDAEGRPSFNLLQNSASSATLTFFIFDLAGAEG